MRLNFEKLLAEMSDDYVHEDADEIPEKGDVIRTKKMQMEGKVESVGKSRAGYDEVLFRIDDGRLMKTPLSNVTIITKLADCDYPMMEAELNELSNELLARYKTAAATDARKSDNKARDDLKSGKKGDFERGNKRFRGINQATRKQFSNDRKKSQANEGSMDGINRVPDLGLKYDKVLDEVHQRWKQEQMEAIDPWHGYTPDDPKANAINKAPKSAVQGTPEIPLSELIKDNIKTHGLKWAFNYHVLKHGLPPRQFQLLAGLMPKRISTPAPLGEADDIGKQFANQVKKQAQPQKKTDEQLYHGWKIRWELIPKVPNGPYKWMAWNAKRDPETAKSGQANSANQAYQDATAFINSGGGEEKNYQNIKNSALNFNAEFSKKYNPENEPFYGQMYNGYFMFSREPQAGFTNATLRMQTGESQHFWRIQLKTGEIQENKLVPNGRYLLEEMPEDSDENMIMFSLHFQSVALDTNEHISMGGPGFTVATSRGKTV